jgi:4-hydroxy-tetrahydrodipicolinate synthase
LERIIGIKEAGSDMDQITRIIDGAKPGFLVWSGNDNETYYIMATGGFGVVSVASHLIGAQIKQMMGLLLEGDVEAAAAEHRRMLPMFKVLFVESNPIPVKYGVNKAGFNVGSPRLPLIPASERAAAEIDKVMSQYTIDLPV